MSRACCSPLTTRQRPSLTRFPTKRLRIFLDQAFGEQQATVGRVVIADAVDAISKKKQTNYTRIRCVRGRPADARGRRSRHGMNFGATAGSVTQAGTAQPVTPEVRPTRCCNSR